MIKNFRGTGTAAVGVIAGLAIAATPALAGAMPNDRVLLAPGDHVPASMLSRAEAEACPLPPTADNAVLVKVKRVLDQRNVSAKVRLSTYEAAWVESHANNLDCGDADSVGVFQQRPASGWGTVAQIRNVPNATKNFLDGNPSDSSAGAIEFDKAHPGWTAGQIAQAVQHSGYPDRYDAERATAVNLIKKATALDVNDKGISAVVLPKNGLALFTRNSTNGRLATRYRNSKGTWTAWIDRDAAVLGSGPDATSRAANTYDVVARRTDGTVIIKSKTTKGWQNWRALAGGLKTNYAPAIVAYNTKTIFVFAVRASDGALLSTRWHLGDGYGPWRKIGNLTQLTSGPDAIKRDGNTVTVAVRDSNGNIRLVHWTAARGWTGATNWGAPRAGTKSGSAPALASRAKGSLDLMVQDNNGGLHRKTGKAGNDWSAPGLSKINQGPDLLPISSKQLKLFARNAGGTPVTATWTGGKGWSSLHKL